MYIVYMLLQQIPWARNGFRTGQICRHQPNSYWLDAHTMVLSGAKGGARRGGPLPGPSEAGMPTQSVHGCIHSGSWQWPPSPGNCCPRSLEERTPKKYRILAASQADRADLILSTASCSVDLLQPKFSLTYPGPANRAPSDTPTPADSKKAVGLGSSVALVSIQAR